MSRDSRGRPIFRQLRCIKLCPILFASMVHSWRDGAYSVQSAMFNYLQFNIDLLGAHYMVEYIIDTLKNIDKQA